MSVRHFRFQYGETKEKVTPMQTFFQIHDLHKFMKHSFLFSKTIYCLIFNIYLIKRGEKELTLDRKKTHRKWGSLEMRRERNANRFNASFEV